MDETLKISLDKLPVKRLDAIEENGVEKYPPPKPLPNEVLSDLAVCAATKLQSYRQLGKYFKQSAKALEQQIAREARFYGALIRLQQNWKVKRQRVAAPASSNEGFTIDLFDNSLYDSAAMSRRPSLSAIRVEHDSAGMLAINLPPNSCRSLHFGFLGLHSADISKESSKITMHSSVEQHTRDTEKESIGDDECIKESHLNLREVHQSIFDEQVFDMVNREAFNQSVGLSVTGIRENYLQLSIGQGTSLFISLVPSSKGDEQAVGPANSQNLDSAIVPLDSFDDLKSGEGKHDSTRKKLGLQGAISPFDDPSHLAFSDIFLDNLYENSSVHSSCRVPVPEIRLPEHERCYKITIPYQGGGA
ncbi:Mediator complex, subunit Med17 [Corchorus olitorius]|uniref:Mediator of RNA polymerase II transcription subunit 17 n=1 Tax=Corchorus olitorius TaxID=93759 RepID=A0A1R3KPW1_9ROSI|nr:Mediator complex, subunit Med17 [Corchorus olitorius]